MLEEISTAVPEVQVQTTAVIIANPTSGSYTQYGHQLEETITYLHAHGWNVTLCLTQTAGDARRLAREAVAQKVNVVIAAGGDGTINEIIQELAGSETALGVLPIGTVNVWARETGIPLDTAAASEVLLYGRRREVDLGLVQNRYFLLMAGIGIDGEVTHAVEKKPLKRLGPLGYLLMGTWLGLGYPKFSAFLQLDGRVIKTRALQLIIGNTQLYGGAIKYTWQAKCDDGLLDICIVRQQNLPGRIIIFLDFLLHRKQRHQWTRYERCKSLKIRTKRPIAMQIDGDPAGYIASGFPATAFTVAPKALKVIVPEHTKENLFVNP
jgi:diacylglycerol kinase (ATP)